MPLQRFSSRRHRLYDAFLGERLKGAVAYDRIAGYFQSSLLGLAAQEFSAIKKVRIVCNTEVNPADVHAIRQATGPRRAELEEALLRRVWNDGRFPHLVDVYGDQAKERLRVLQELVQGNPTNERSFEVRIVPDCEFGFVHGKAGIIRYAEKSATSFIGSANDTERAWSKNYELVWEDDTAESIRWVQEEFDALWDRGFPVSEFIVKQIGRLGKRTIIEHVGDWKKKPNIGQVLAEVPTCTELFGFWEHQKYFIKKVFDEHRRYASMAGRGARYLLADGVGLGKTLQMGGIAKLIGTLDDDPVLIIAPKAVVSQWQDELLDKLAAPSALWTGRGWLTERDEFHPSTETDVLNCPRKIAIVPTSVVLSATRSKFNGKLTEELLKKRFSCVLWDEAHKIRRNNLQRPKELPDKNHLYDWGMQLAARARTMILATATPVQLHPVELWDLLNVLSVNNEHVLGTQSSRWRQTEPVMFDILSGRGNITDVFKKWEYWKDPLPREEDSEVFRQVRTTLCLSDTTEGTTNASFDQLDALIKEDLQRNELSDLNPFTTRVIKRSREKLEKAGKLVPIEMIPVDDDNPVVASHSIRQALELAEEFSRELHKHTKASGFILTMLQRRVGSSVLAGFNTASKMLEEREIEDEDGLNETGESIYPLPEEARKLLGQLRDHLQRQLQIEDDPKFERILTVLRSKVDAITWLDRGALIFTQYYDSAHALCEYLAPKLGISIGLYGSSAASKLFEDGKVQRISRGILIEKIDAGVLKVLVGTDAASTGLNLQRLGSLINLDLPWNPTTLEQRKGRVQRGTTSKRIPFCNLRYNEGVENRLFNVLTGRIQAITDIFGTIPDFITDDWVTAMLENKKQSESDLIQMATGRAGDPFTVKETYEYLKEDWESTAEVLNSKEATETFLHPW